MSKKLVYRGLILICSFQTLFCVAEGSKCHLGHRMSGTAYGEVGVKRYASIKHGPDGALFLDPYFLFFIENVENQKILDAGCGAAPWAIYAAVNGAFVYGIDIQASMIEKGNEEILKAGLENQIILEVGSVNHLPYENDFFDKGISINVGCNLPRLDMHLREMVRVLKEKSRVIITAPASLDIIFTSGRRELLEIMNDIEDVLNKIDGEDPNSIVEYLSTLNDVYRATFVNVGGKLKLITDINNLKDGEKIWRKLPGMAVPNVYHSENEYISEAIKAGFEIIRIEKPKFNSEAELMQYNAEHSEQFRIGDAYLNHNAFMIIELEKVANSS